MADALTDRCARKPCARSARAGRRRRSSSPAIGAALDDTFYLRLATEALIFAGLALSVDILLGYTGLLSLGQALYFGLGAYISALVLKAVPSFWLALAARARRRTGARARSAASSRSACAASISR